MFHLFTKIDSISTNELKTKLKEPIQLLDVRTPTEFHRGHIESAKNVPLTEIGSYEPATKETLYLICQSGVRSKMAAKKKRLPCHQCPRRYEGLEELDRNQIYIVSCHSSLGSFIAK